MSNPEQNQNREQLADREAVIQGLREGDTTLLHVYISERESHVYTREDRFALVVDTAMLYAEAGLVQDALIALDNAIMKAEQEGLKGYTAQIAAMRDELLHKHTIPTSLQDTTTDSDYPMGVARMALIPYEQIEDDALTTIAELERAGLVVPDELRARYTDAVQRRKIAQYLAQITDGRERVAALKAINAGDIPPEVLKSEDSFVVQGTSTIQ